MQQYRKSARPVLQFDIGISGDTAAWKEANLNTAYIVDIYCRISREDLKSGKRDFSMSIENQQAMLLNYAEQQGWTVHKVIH